SARAGPKQRFHSLRISRAALLVKVTASTPQGLALPVESRCARRVVSTRVLPVPAPANTSTGPSSASTAARCSGLSDVRYGAAAAARTEIGKFSALSLKIESSAVLAS